MLLLQCPKCKNTMKYQPLKQTISQARKACVYCGKSIRVKEAIIKSG